MYHVWKCFHPEDDTAVPAPGCPTAPPCSWPWGTLISYSTGTCKAHSKIEMGDNISSAHSEISSGLKGKQISINTSHEQKAKLLQDYLWTENKHNSVFIPHPEGLLLLFLLDKWMWFEPSKKPHCRVQQGIVFALDLPLLHSFHWAAVQHLTCQGSDTSGHKNLFMKPRAPGLDSQSFTRQITPRRSLQSSEVHNKIPFIITASFSLSSFLKISSSCF